MTMLIKNFSFLAIVTVIAVVAIVGVAIIDSSVGLHTLVLTGDIDLVLIAFVCSLLISIIIVNKKSKEERVPSTTFESFVGVGVSMLAVILYGVVEGGLLDGGLESAYLVAFLTVSVVFFATYVVTEYLCSKKARIRF